MRSLTGPRRTAALATAATLGLVLAACATTHAEKAATQTDPESAATAHAESGHDSLGQRAGSVPLRRHEERVTVRMPEAYTPSAPTGTGTDDYRCFLLDPKVSADRFITGFNVLPDNPDVVHHVILFRVPTDQVAEAEERDAATPGQGWTCFGGSGLGRDLSIDDAPWLGAWAPGGSEQVYARGFGERLDRGSRVIMQVHYHLRAGKGPDRSAAELRLAPVSDKIETLHTQLLPAPVEMPCRTQHGDGELCDRAASLTDLKKRVGEGPGMIADLLHYLCGPVKASPVQSCTRRVRTPETVRGVAGHMHLLGRSIKIEVNPGKPDARTLLDIPVWDFDNQGSRPIKPAVLRPGDTLKVTCRHKQGLRDRLPAFAGVPDKYVVWGEGTTDEMCLALLMVTRP